MPIHKLPELPYAYDALEPHIDARTMEIHHGRHHQTYVDNLNKTLEGHADLQDRTVENLIADLDSVPETIRTAVRNNGGGHANHSFFWSIMKPRGGGRPVGDLAGAVARELGGFDSLRDQLTKAGLGRFGSGWAWLSFDEGRLLVESTANQDSPLSLGRAPVLAVDVWEHAYYLKYQNRRAEYLEAWWNTIDWQAVSDRYDQLCGMTR